MLHMKQKARPVRCYSLVEDFHTYFVGNSRVLVHNACTNPNGQQIYQVANGQWKDVLNNRYAVGPDGPAVHPSNTEAGSLQGGAPEALIRGQYTEARIFSLLHLPKNIQLWINGHIPDVVWSDGVPLEIKDCQYLYASTQLKAFAGEGPFDLIVTPDTVIANPLLDLVQKCGGAIYVMDSESGFITQIGP